MVDLDRRIRRLPKPPSGEWAGGLLENVFGIVPRRNRKEFRSSGLFGNERVVFNVFNIYMIYDILN